MISGLLLGLLNAMAQAPVANFSATPTSGCGPLTVRFTDLSTNNPTFWSWDFGNGQVSSNQNPNVTYTTPGTYSVRLIARNASGADVAEMDNFITVYPYPSPKFIENLNPAVYCAPANVQFTDESTPGTGSITSWSWNFGDGSTSNQESPSHTYTQTGYFNVALTVTNSGGCSNSASVGRAVRVINGIQPNFVFDQSSASCSAPFTGQLLNQSSGPGNLSFSWTMSNGATPSSSADTSPAVTFPSVGQYNVNLAVTSSLGCSATVQQTLNLNNNSAAINGPTTACVNTPVTFTDGANSAPPTVIWTFSDGTTANGASVTRTFSSPGTYTVSLQNKYAGCSVSGTQTITIVNTPTPDFSTTSVTTACKPSLAVQFTDQSTPAANVTTWLWDFGDGQTSTQQSPLHTYATTGIFNVTLTITGPGGCSKSVTKNAFVTIQAPTATIAGILTGCVSSASAFNVVKPTVNLNSVDPAQTYLWTANGATPSTSTSATPSFSYPGQGAYTISVTVTTTGGCQTTASTTVNIGVPLPGPAPDFSISSNPVCSNNSVTFTTTTTGAGDYSWSFGDPSAVQEGPTLTTISHQYQDYGPHTVTLLVYNGVCPEQAQHVIQVDPPFAGFKFATPTPVNCANESLIQFTDTSLVDPTIPSPYGAISWSWNFGDPANPNNTSTLQNPQHHYPPGTSTPQPYIVTLTITQGSCSSTTQHTVTIGSITPSFTMPAVQCHDGPINLVSTSTPAALDSLFSWQLDGGTYTTPSPSPTLDTTFYGAASDGNHTISLTVYDINGCPTATPATQTITIRGPNAHYIAPAGGCKGSPITYTDASTPDPNNGSPLHNAKFDWDDHITPVTGNLWPGPYSHAFPDTGRFLPLYTVTDMNACSDTSESYIQITSPIANFGTPDSFYCPGVPMTFIDSSQGYGLQESWDFGNGSTVTSPAPPITTYAANNTYSVVLKVTDQYGCTDSKTKPVVIHSPIAAFNIYDTTAICFPLETIFAAHGQYYDSLYWKFGDGTTSTLDSTSHFYNAYGFDTAKLFLEGPGGCLDSASYRVQINNPGTTTSLNYSPLSHCDSVPVQFTLVNPPYSLFDLLFGDGAADSSQNLTPFHTYHNPSTYLPQMVLTDETGCIVDYGTGVTITVLGATPFFSVNQHAFCDSGIVNFTDYTISNDGFATETYVFGDGSPNQSETGGSGGFDVMNNYDKIGIWTATLQVVTRDGCAESYSDTIRVYQTPHPAITVPPVTCAGPIQFQGSITTTQIDSISWSWNFGNGETSKLQNPTVPMAPGTYTVKLDASVPFGCIDSTASTVSINPPPDISGPHELTSPLGIPVTIPFTYSSNVVSYNWTPAVNLSCSDCANPVATVTIATTYTVTVTDANSCTASDTILIKTVCNDKNYWFPNTFSPNGDGVNDYFYPRGTSLYNIQSLTIFNRWGQMVFQRRDFPANAQNMGWDGTFGGKLAPSDAYVYIAEVICDNAQLVTISGNVTLIR